MEKIYNTHEMNNISDIKYMINFLKSTLEYDESKLVQMTKKKQYIFL